LRERLQMAAWGGVQQKRNMDIVDNIYDRAERRTVNLINKYVFTDEKGLKHRLKEKTLAEEHLEKLESNVTDNYELNRNVNKMSVVTELSNKAFVTNQAKVNQEKLKGHFDLMINHNLQMSKKIEMYANDNVAFFLHKNRNFISKLVKGQKELDE
jgi:hypothetical protein